MIGGTKNPYQAIFPDFKKNNTSLRRFEEQKKKISVIVTSYYLEHFVSIMCSE